MAKVIKRVWKTGRTRHVAYGYTVQLGDKQVRKFDSAWTKEQAQDALAERILERDAVVEEPTPAAAVMTLGQAVDKYLAEKGTEKRSLRDDRRSLGRFVRAFGTELPLADVTAKRISAYKAERAVTVLARRPRRAQYLAPATVNRELAALRHLLALAAREWEVLERIPSVRLLKEPEGRLRYLTAAEIEQLLTACDGSQNTHLRSIVTLAVHTGMRKGELLGLTWDRIDFARGVMKLEKTKTGRRREVPMNRAAYDALSALPGPKDAGRLFRKTSGAAWGSIRTAFERACRAAGLENFRFHDLRHTAASQLLMRGATLPEVRDVLGHSDLKMTLRYAHLSPAHLRSAVARLDGLTAAPMADVSAHGSAHDGRILEPAR